MAACSPSSGRYHLRPTYIQASNLNKQPYHSYPRYELHNQDKEQIEYWRGEFAFTRTLGVLDT